jgi:ssDNA-binding replication factor A large subunit
MSDEPDICPCCGQVIELQKKSKKEREDDFLKFWKMYPRKTGKLYCQAIWERKKLTSEIVLPGLIKCITSREWKKNEGEFIPNPSTFLNQGRWEDEGIDYAVLSQRQVVKPLMKVDYADAERWRKENYELSDALPFDQWPIHVRKQYLKTL